MSLRAAATSSSTSVVSPGEPELLDTDEQEAVIAGLVRSHETSVRVWKAVFGLLGVLFALAAAHSALEQRAAPWGAEHAAALRGALSHDALMTAYMLAALTHGGAAAALAALSPRSHEHRRPAWVGDARVRGPLCVGAAAAAASCVGWVAACIASRGALLAPPVLLLGWGGAGYVAVVVYVIREAGAFGRDLDGLRSARYEFKKA